MLRLENVSVDIAGAPVLRGVDLVVPPGARVALIGRNGAGKTTTLRTLMGLLPARGGISIDGQACTDAPAHRRAALGIGYAPRSGGCSAASPFWKICACRRKC
jgi:ABC-type branched-subunit amino acid transport system ATPase component